MGAVPAPRRWIFFNGIGVLGFALQLGTLALLVSGLGMHYLPATLLAVEAAVLHNFLWHRRWTWADRPEAGRGEALRRLGRFHLANGLLSLVGNMLMMVGLTGVLGWHPLPANAITVLTWSGLNFVTSDRFVFRTAALALIALLIAPGAVRLEADGADGPRLGPVTLEAWQKYQTAVDARYGRQRSSGAFFAHDEFGQDPTWRARARAGEITMFQAPRPAPDLPEPDIPDGRVHHWVGAVFVPGAKLDTVLDYLIQNAGREADAYEDVVASRLLQRNGSRLRVFMKLRRESIVTVVYNTEHDVEYRRGDGTRASSRSVATKIAELAEPGSPREREKPAGEDHGFLWRLNAYWRYEQVSDGVFIECESVSLSRDVPLLLKPFIGRTVDRIARESLERTLRTLRGTLVKAGAASAAATSTI